MAHKNVKRFGGELYYYFNHSSTKKGAQGMAERKRRSGLKVRVVKEGSYWAVYTRPSVY